MTVVIQPTDLGSLIKDLDRRLRILETTARVQGALLTNVAQSDITQNQNYVITAGVDQDMAMDRIDTWTVVRNPWHLIYCIAYGKTTGASGNYGYVRASIRKGPNPSDEVDSFDVGTWDKGVGGFLPGFGYHLALLNPVTTYQVHPVVHGDTGITLGAYYSHIDVLQLGA